MLLKLYYGTQKMLLKLYYGTGWMLLELYCGIRWMLSKFYNDSGWIYKRFDITLKKKKKGMKSSFYSIYTIAGKECYKKRRFLIVAIIIAWTRML